LLLLLAILFELRIEVKNHEEESSLLFTILLFLAGCWDERLLKDVNLIMINVG
jgi:hypothetical protein